MCQIVLLFFYPLGLQWARLLCSGWWGWMEGWRSAGWTSWPTSTRTSRSASPGRWTGTSGKNNGVSAVLRIQIHWIRIQDFGWPNLDPDPRLCYQFWKKCLKCFRRRKFVFKKIWKLSLWKKCLVIWVSGWWIFLFVLTPLIYPIFTCIDPDQDHYSEYGSGSWFTKFLNRINLDPDPNPQHG